MNDQLLQALQGLHANGRRLDGHIAVLRRHLPEAVPVLVGLLTHPDPAWRLRAASALGRLRATPVTAMPALRQLLRSPDAGARIAAIIALEALPTEARRRAVPAVTHLLQSQPSSGAAFTEVRTHLPRAIAAHFVGLHGGPSGLVALGAMRKRRKDPVAHQIQAAIEEAKARLAGSRIVLKARRRTKG